MMRSGRTPRCIRFTPMKAKKSTNVLREDNKTLLGAVSVGDTKITAIYMQLVLNAIELPENPDC